MGDLSPIPPIEESVKYDPSLLWLESEDLLAFAEDHTTLPLDGLHYAAAAYCIARSNDNLWHQAEAAFVAHSRAKMLKLSAAYYNRWAELGVSVVNEAETTFRTASNN